MKKYRDMSTRDRVIGGFGSVVAFGVSARKWRGRRKAQVRERCAAGCFMQRISREVGVVSSQKMGSAVIHALSESGGEDGECESDSDGASTLASRRRAASDDEEDEGGSQRRVPLGDGVHHRDAASSVDEEGPRLPYSDEEEADDTEGAPPLYEEDEEEEEEELLADEEQEQQRHRKLTALTFQEGAAGKNGEDSSGLLGREAVKYPIVVATKFPCHPEPIPALTGITDLKLPQGAKILSISDVADPVLRESFDANLYLQNLRAAQFGAFVLFSPLIPSTQTLLSQNFHVFPQGTICIAGAQLQGKGRAGNVWESPKGCLMFSFTIQMTSGRLLPFLQYVVSLAVIEGLEESCKVKGIPAPELRIKWPNDLYAKGLKIGGVLCTSTYSNKTFNIVVGVGLNASNRMPTTCLDALIQELDPQAGALRQEELLAAIMSRFEELNVTFSADGFSSLQESYYKRWLHSGQKIVLEEKDPESSDVSYIPVTIRGLTLTGYLLATDEQGEQYELHPDGNSFDFLKGLVRSKLAS